MIALLPISLLCAGAHMGATPLILDTYLGGDIDDTWALCMILGSENLDLKLITTAFGDTERKTRLVAKILEYVGRTDIPIGTGKKTSDHALNQEKWLGDYSLEHYAGTVHEDGVQALIDAIHAADGIITVCVIGPQTNIAEALKRDPSIAKKARIVSMAGSVYIGYGGKETPDPEWNVVADVPAARAVFAAPWEIVWTPLDTCGNIILRGERYQRVAQSKSKLARVVIENYHQWSVNKRGENADASSILFDTVAVYLCTGESLCDMETVKLSIADKGMTVVDEKKGRPVRCALKWKDRDAFEEMMIRALTGEGK